MSGHQHDKISPSVWKITAVAVMGSLLAQLDATIVNVSLSTLATEMHATLSTIQWVTSGYLLALTFILPLSGWLTERIGGKRLYLLCFCTFTLSSGLCGLAWSVNSLIAFRLLQGLSGGLLAPMAQMMIARAAGRQFARIAGYAAFPVLLGPIIGPVIAGVILHYSSWRWLFLVNVPVGILAMVLAVLFLPDDRDEHQYRSLDWLGLLLLSPGLALLLYGAEQSIAAYIGLALVMLVIFLLVENRKGEGALIDLSQFRNRTFSTSSVVQFLSNGVMFAGQMLIPLFLIEYCHQSPAMMGWLLAPLGIGMLISIPMMGALTSRFGIRRVAAGGALLALVATGALTLMAFTTLNLPLLAVALLLRGMGSGAVGLPAVSAVYATVPRERLPMATTTLNVIQRLGGPTLTTLCAVFLTSMQTEKGDPLSSQAWGYAFLLLTTLHAVTFVTAMLLPKENKQRE